MDISSSKLMVLLFLNLQNSFLNNHHQGNNNFASAQPYLGPPGAIGGMPSTGDCFKDFQHLKDRFSPEQLQFFCQQWRSYTEAVDGNFTVVDSFTPAQLTYIQSLSISSANLEAAPSTNPSPTKAMSVRKEYRAMSDSERSVFHFVLRAMKQQKIDGISKYDLLVMLSYPALAPGARVGAAYLPWHREYLRTFEAAMQKVNAFVTLPYWNPTFEQGLPNGAESILWEPNFLGNGDGPVTSGPFAGWLLHPIEKKASVHQESENASSADTATLVPLARNLSGAGRLMTPDDESYIISRTEFRQFSACVDLRLEQTNRYVHEWVGGSMYDVSYSANDPLFFMFHAYVDYLWEEWRRNSSYDQRVFGYPANYEACTKFHYANSTMSPFDQLVNADGLSDGYTRQYYTYQLSPTCSKDNTNCMSNLLFCDTAKGRCLSKIRVGGDCRGLQTFDPCYQSICVNGKCAPDASGGGGVVSTGVKLLPNSTAAAAASTITTINKNVQSAQPAAVPKIVGGGLLPRKIEAPQVVPPLLKPKGRKNEKPITEIP